jgi:hypothetical protein
MISQGRIYFIERPWFAGRRCGHLLVVLSFQPDRDACATPPTRAPAR